MRTTLSFRNFSAEERTLWDFARNWRSPEHLALPEALDWERFFTIAESNRMLPLLDRIFQADGFSGVVPDEIGGKIRDQVEKTSKSTALLSASLQEYLRKAGHQGLDTVVHKGLWLSHEIYGGAAIRPGSDIDLLVRQSQVQASLETLQEMGIAQFWPNLLDDRYYLKHHLHLQRCSEDLKVWFEIHWALDHPYTHQTIDYEAMLDRAATGELFGEPVLVLSPADLMLSLAVHLVKHAVYLPALVGRADLPQIILADGMLMYYLDVAGAIERYAAAIDWESTLQLAVRSGCVDILGSVLRVCRERFAAPVPDRALDALPVRGSTGLTRQVMQAMADHELAIYRGGEPDRLWQFLVMPNGAFILRPIRVLELLGYIFPDRDFLTRRYGAAGLKVRLLHALKAVAACLALGADTAYYTWERYRRLKRLKLSASLFNRLEVDA